MSEVLTSENFWNDFWTKIKLPVMVDWNFKNDKVIAEEILKAAPAKAGMTAIEVGCAPGKWLSFLAKDMGCNVTGIEYLASAAAKTEENLRLQNINTFDVIVGDFLANKIDKKFDIVLSLGFIEHFDNFEKVLDGHLALLNTNGYLIIGIPRFRGINYYIQTFIDKYIKNKLIPSHNLKTMSLEVYDQYASKNKLQIITNKYIGGFEQGIFTPNEIKIFPIRIFAKIVLRVLNKLLGRIDSQYISGFQIAVF